MHEAAPRIQVDPFVATRDRERWLVTWRLSNFGHEPLRLVSALQPHSEFRTDETPLVGSIPAGGSTDVTLPVRFRKPPGEVVENPFLIIRVAARAGRWNVLARVRITAGQHGEPLAASDVVVTVNPADTGG